MSAALDIQLPLADHDDDDDVRTALVIALRCWQHDDLPEALRFLRRAAREAADNDHVERALELSKAAAELAARLDDESDTPRRSTVVPSDRRIPRAVVPAPPPLPRMMPRPQLASIPPVPVDDASPIPLARPASTSIFDQDDDEPTVIRSALSPNTTMGLEDGPSPVGLTACRVAVFANLERGALEVAPLESDEPPPKGAPVAMLVAPSAHDAERLAALLRQISRRW